MPSFTENISEEIFDKLVKTAQDQSALQSYDESKHTGKIHSHGVTVSFSYAAPVLTVSHSIFIPEDPIRQGLEQLIAVDKN